MFSPVAPWGFTGARFLQEKRSVGRLYFGLSCSLLAYIYGDCTQGMGRGHVLYEGLYTGAGLYTCMGAVIMGVGRGGRVDFYIGLGAVHRPRGIYMRANYMVMGDLGDYTGGGGYLYRGDGTQ